MYEEWWVGRQNQRGRLGCSGAWGRNEENLNQSVGPREQESGGVQAADLTRRMAACGRRGAGRVGCLWIVIWHEGGSWRAGHVGHI